MVFLLFLWFPIITYGKDTHRDTKYRQAPFGKYTGCNNSGYYNGQGSPQ